MQTDFQQRLNQVIGKLTSPDFLSSNGLGNDIGFWIFDYPIEQDDLVMDYLNGIVIQSLKSPPYQLRVVHINLFEFLIELLKERNLLDKVIEFQKTGGDQKTLDAIRPVLKEDKLAQKLSSMINHDQTDMVILSGVASAYPMLRTHTLLSALHPFMQDTPLVMFYPGKYDGQSLRLFNTLEDDHYYRAFRLVP
ncbi:DUF1788 domain-containing protein [Methylophilus sp.]|uniref:DUF1788 domain-containing protein n=1 Tax=Methylophilus sp. TaxID=29541 RepID=UPI0011D39280|nr:DUF1788 domain-containing protein [Methylophilus sp.]TXI44177.1 MAG: DUF1788 domain-containing protein [Methylophilus sp.]